MTSQANSNPITDWPRLIKQKRLELGESQAEFGKRFNVSHVTVSYWEKGQFEAPYKVTWWLVAQGVLSGN